jgi:phosphatidylinositol-4,5-bisphosphate 3-kinase
VTSSNEVIKNLLRLLYKEHQIKLTPKSQDNQFVMQVSGFKEFLTGTQPILQFDRVRICLRGMKYLEVILTEVPQRNEQSERFPPIIVRQKGKFLPIDWAFYKEVPILLWYPPFKIPSMMNM